MNEFMSLKKLAYQQRKFLKIKQREKKSGFRIHSYDFSPVGL